MKKIVCSVTALCLCVVLAGCSSADDEQDLFKDNEIALSMTYPKSFEDMNYMVAGDWEELYTDTQVTYLTEYGTILISSTTGKYEEHVTQMLGFEGTDLEEPVLDEPSPIDPEEGVPEEEGLADAAENNPSYEEIEIDGYAGIQQAMVIGGSTVETFAIFVGEKTYCIVLAYNAGAEQGKSFEAIDTLVSSISFNVTDLDLENGEDIVNIEAPENEEELA